MHTAIQERPLIINGLEEALYISIGVIFCGGDEEKSPDWFISQADIALYQAKQRGKNNIDTY